MPPPFPSFLDLQNKTTLLITTFYTIVPQRAKYQTLKSSTTHGLLFLFLCTSFLGNYKQKQPTNITSRMLPSHTTHLSNWLPP